MHRACGSIKLTLACSRVLPHVYKSLQKERSHLSSQNGNFFTANNWIFSTPFEVDFSVESESPRQWGEVTEQSCALRGWVPQTLSKGSLTCIEASCCSKTRNLSWNYLEKRINKVWVGVGVQSWLTTMSGLRHCCMPGSGCCRTSQPEGQESHSDLQSVKKPHSSSEESSLFYLLCTSTMAC